MSKRLAGICAAVVLVMALPASAAGSTINVPADYPTVQLAINAAVDGDTISRCVECIGDQP